MRIGDDGDAHPRRLGEQRQAVAPLSSPPRIPASAPTTAATPSIANAPARLPTVNRGCESAPVAAPAASLAMTNAGSIGLIAPEGAADGCGFGSGSTWSSAWPTFPAGDACPWRSARLA